MKFLLPTLALFAASTAAHADIITALASAPTATGDGFYAYTYDVQLSGGQLDPTNAGVPVQFGTVYDFGPLANLNGTPYIAETGLLADSGMFRFSFQNTSSPASSAGASVLLLDDPTLLNIRFTYVGSTGINVSGQNTTLGSSAVTVGNSDNNLGTFTVYSPYSTVNSTGTYDGQSYKGTNNTVQANFGSVSIPAPAAIGVTPEPSSLALLGTGLLGVAGVMRRRLF